MAVIFVMSCDETKEAGRYTALEVDGGGEVCTDVTDYYIGSFRHPSWKQWTDIVEQPTCIYIRSLKDKVSH